MDMLAINEDLILFLLGYSKSMIDPIRGAKTMMSDEKLIILSIYQYHQHLYFA